jgi:hypothetical protein
MTGIRSRSPNKEPLMNRLTRTLCPLTITMVSILALAGTSVAKTADPMDGPGGVNSVPCATAYLTGLTNKLNAMLDELPNAGIGRPRC